MSNANKQSLVNHVRNELDCSLAEAHRAVGAVLSGIEDSIVMHDKLTLSGIGTFTSRKREPMRRYDMNAGKLRMVPGKWLLKFTPSPRVLVKLKDAKETDSE